MPLFVRFYAFFLCPFLLFSCEPAPTTSSQQPTQKKQDKPNTSETQDPKWAKKKADLIQSAIDKDNKGTLGLTNDRLSAPASAFHRSFKDEFKRLGPWPALKNQQNQLCLNNYGYAIKHTVDSTAFHVSVPLQIDTMYNWAIESKIRLITLDSSSLFGLHIGYHATQKTGNFLLINPIEGSLTIKKVCKDSLVYYLQNRPCAAISKTVNTLRIESTDHFWFYYLNNYLVYCHPSAAITHDKFGFSIDGRAQLEAAYFQIQW